MAGAITSMGVARPALAAAPFRATGVSPSSTLAFAPPPALARTEQPVAATKAVRPGRPFVPLEFASQEALQRGPAGPPGGETEAAPRPPAGDGEADAGGKNVRGEPVDATGLTEAERRKVESLEERDREVRRHEQSHVAAGGGHASHATYRFVQGPDGKQYAVSGEVKIDTSPVPNNPEATIRKMEVVKRAALAPQQPSTQDRRVAAQAEAAITKARREIGERDAEEAEAERARRSEKPDGDERRAEAELAIFDPERRFRAVVGGTGELADDPGLVGAGDVDLRLDTLEPAELFNLTA